MPFRSLIIKILKNKKYHTVGTNPKSNIKIVDSHIIPVVQVNVEAVSTIFLLDIETVLTVWYFFFHFFFVWVCRFCIDNSIVLWSSTKQYILFTRQSVNGKHYTNVTATN